MEDIHERLQWMRRQRGYEHAADAAQAFGWNEVTYRAHEAGDRGIRHAVAEKYSKAFRYNLSWFLTGKGSPDGNGAEIIDIWTRIPERDRSTARRMLESLAEPKKEKWRGEKE